MILGFTKINVWHLLLGAMSNEVIDCRNFFHFSTSYPSTNIGCVSQYLQKARPEFRDIRYVFVKDTYDSFLEKHEQGNSTYNEFISPDLITILNCGFIFYDSWNASIPHLFKFPNIPVIFTEYHEKDAESNLQKVKALGKVIILLNSSIS